MSSFLSNKFLQYRAIGGTPQPIEHDFFCTSCGYNLRGLQFGRNCPECGMLITKKPGTKDALLSGDERYRGCVWTGLMLLAVSLFVVAIARLAIFIVLVFTGSATAHNVYLWLGMLISAAWTTGTWCVTLRDMDAHLHRWKWLRITARLSQTLWIPAYALWIIGMNSPGANAERLVEISFLMRGFAAICVLLLIVWLMKLAESAELEDEQRRLNLCIWMLPVPTILLGAVPTQVPWIFLGLIFFVMLVWLWYVILLGRAVLGMERHVAWAMNLAVQQAGREVRIAEMRSELEQSVAAMVRPVRRTKGELPLDPAQPKPKSP